MNKDKDRISFENFPLCLHVPTYWFAMDSQGTSCQEKVESVLGKIPDRLFFWHLSYPFDDLGGRGPFFLWINVWNWVILRSRDAQARKFQKRTVRLRSSYSACKRIRKQWNRYVSCLDWDERITPVHGAWFRFWCLFNGKTKLSKGAKCKLIKMNRTKINVRTFWFLTVDMYVTARHIPAVCVLTRAGRVTQSVRLRPGYRKQSLSLHEPLCHDLVLPQFPVKV